MKIFPSQSGFTLIELIIVIVISGIIAAGTARFIAHTATGYVATGLRQGNGAMGVIVSEKISRELRSALPNSVRVNGGNTCIEFVPVLAADKYSAAPISPSAAASSITLHNTTYTLSGSINEYAAIYPSSTSSVYSPSNNTPLTATQIAAVTTTSVTLGANHQFPADSPSRRVYIVTEPVSYCYASVSGQNGIFRYSGYGFNAAMVAPPTGGTRSMLVNNVNPGSVNFDVEPATLTRNALAGISFQVIVDASYSATDESLYIDQEVQIRNAP